MKSDNPFPQVEVAVILIARAHRYLAEYNPHWKKYTLPMSRLKRRVVGSDVQQETPAEGAIRVAAEAIGRPLPPHTLPRRLELDMPAHQLNRSGRDGYFKNYTYRVFGVRLSEPNLRHALGRHILWMGRDEFLTHVPVSSSAVFIWERLGEDELSRQLEGFPGL